MTATVTTVATSQQAKERLAVLERKRAALPAEIRQARQAEARGERDATARRAQLELRAEELPAIIADLQSQLAALEAQENEAREAVFQERRRVALAAVQAAQRQGWADVCSALSGLAMAAGKYRRAIEGVGELQAEITGNPERRRLEIRALSGGGSILIVAETLAAWLIAEPASDFNVEVIGRITGGQGEALRLARDGFFTGLGRQP